MWLVKMVLTKTLMPTIKAEGNRNSPEASALGLIEEFHALN